MEIIRRRKLPQGWYPGQFEEVRELNSKWVKKKPGITNSLSIIAPHAGWMFSGELAAKTIACFSNNIQTLVVIGGHLLPGASLHYAPENAFDVPGGVLDCDIELRSYLSRFFTMKPDSAPDNSVEVQMPLVFHLLGNIKIIWLRAAPDESAIRLGKILAEYREKTGTQLAVLGSTDLTHYGDNYNFTPKGTGTKALSWVKEENDAELVKAFLSMEPLSILRVAQEGRSACSAGAAATAAAFAIETGVKKARLTGYHTSYDIFTDSSFVGYAGVVYY